VVENRDFFHTLHSMPRLSGSPSEYYNNDRYCRTKCYVEPFWHNTSMLRTDRQTSCDSTVRPAQCIASHGKMYRNGMLRESEVSNDSYHSGVRTLKQLKTTNLTNLILCQYHHHHFYGAMLRIARTMLSNDIRPSVWICLSHAGTGYSFEMLSLVVHFL